VGVGVALEPPPSPAHADINKEKSTTQQNPAARRNNMGNSWACSPVQTHEGLLLLSM
jgi:hypothetical protein